MQRYAKYRHYLHRNRLTQAIMHRWKSIPKATLVKNVLLLGLGALFLMALVSLGAYIWIAKTLPDPNDIGSADVAQSTKIYDRTGEHLLYEIAADQKRTLVSLDEIPDELEKATITAEDRKFYSHFGIDIKGIVRAVLADILSGSKKQGASTITQQLVRNVILTLEKSYTRKVKEIILSIAVEQRYTKDQILEMYLNQISYGSTNYGVESASQAYFDKSVTNLSLAESATLAALPKATTTYLNNPDMLKDRRDWILGSMAELGYVTQEQADAAMLEDTEIRATATNITAPHFVMWVKGQLVDEYTERVVEEGGLKVITTLDYDKQLMAEQAVLDGVTARGESYNFNNAAQMSVDPKTGQILSMVGSVDYFNDEIDGQVNVTQRLRQPGSSIKPVVYSAAFAKGYTPNTIMWDVDTIFSTATGPYHPQNYDGTEHGYLTMRKALQGSLNIPAVQTLYLTGLEQTLQFAEKLGYTTFEDRSRIGLSFALGGNEVTMMEHINTFATFANGGKRNDLAGILSVEDADGNMLQEWKAEEHAGEQVMDANLAATITNVISDNNARAYVFGPSNYLYLGARPVAAKTGTTNNYNDAWTLGYTPSLVSAVWVGNTDGTEMHRGADSSKTAAPIWNAFMTKALEGTLIEAFPSATIAATGKTMLDGTIPTSTYTIDTASGKLATELTPEKYREEISCGEYHTILKYVNKDNPTGAEPTRPEDDPYYAVWEQAVQDYIPRHNAALKDGESPITTCKDIPTEEDDVHTSHNQPDISIKDPNSGSDVGRTFAVKVSTETKRDFDRVVYEVDNSMIATSTSNDGTTLTLPSWVGTGNHVLRATVYDDVDNSASDEITIRVTEAGSETTLRITNPFHGQTIEKTASTYDVIVEVPNVDEVTYLEVTAFNTWTGESQVIGSTMSPSAITSISWNLPDAAEYTLIARAATTESDTIESAAVNVRVKEAAVVTIESPVTNILQ